jgi:hypothetical protein
MYVMIEWLVRYIFASLYNFILRQSGECLSNLNTRCYRGSCSDTFNSARIEVGSTMYIRTILYSVVIRPEAKLNKIIIN